MRLYTRTVGERLQNCGTVIRDMPADFVGQTQHEADCCKIRAKVAD